MRKFYVNVGMAQTQNGPVDIMKEVTGADFYEVDEHRVLRFIRWVDGPLVDGPKVRDENLCSFGAWNFVYSTEALPADLVVATDVHGGKRKQ